MRPRFITEEQFSAMEQAVKGNRVRGRQGKHLPLRGANDGPVPNETGNTVRNSRMAGNKDTAPVSLRGKSANALDRAGRGQAYSPEAGHAMQLRTKESERRTNAGARPAPSPSIYRSKREAAYATKLELEKRAGLIKAYAYEMHTFKLAHRQYHRTDFLIWHLDNSIEIAQVKGWHKNMRAGIKGLKWAATLNPWFTWTVKRWTGAGWDSSYVEV